MDRKLVYSLSKSRIPSLRQLKYLKKYLSKKELFVMRVSIVVALASIVFLSANFYFNNLQVVPVRGGGYSEGLVGRPQYINPLYAGHTDVDSDLSSLVFSSLFKRGAKGELVKDLASNVRAFDNYKTFVVAIRDDAFWHDTGMKWESGRQVSVEDVIFTFQAIKNSDFKSSLRQSLTGVKVELVDNEKVKFSLPEPYAEFPELLTFGILPSELWRQISPESALLTELNLKPIGSGPYKFDQFAKDKNGNIKQYELTANQEYYNDVPFIESLTFRFYPNYEEMIAALNNNVLDGISYLPLEHKEALITPKAYQMHELDISEITSVFFNQKNLKVQDTKVRQALAYAIDRGAIIKDVLSGEGRKIDSPILSVLPNASSSVKVYGYDPGEAASLLEEAGWETKPVSEEMLNQARDSIENSTSSVGQTEGEDGGGQNPVAGETEKDEKSRIIMDLGEGEWRQKDNDFLRLELATVRTGKNEEVVKQIKRFWENVGVKTDIKLLDFEEVRDKIMDNRNFEAFFYGYTVNSLSDSFAFWHSSQTGSGLSNITGYKSEKVDSLLEEARQIGDPEERMRKYNEFRAVLSSDVPAIFMHSSAYVYPQSKKVKGFGVEKIFSPKDRFADIEKWYIKTGKKLMWE